MKQIIQYIKLREQLLQVRRVKSGALGTIRSGLVRFDSFIAYQAIDRYFLYEEMQALYAQSPNFKYFFYLALFFGLWGLLDCGLGIAKYFQAKDQVEELKQQVETLERELCQ